MTVTEPVVAPTVTVVVPVLDEVEDLGRCLDAIAVQDTDAIVEVLVVDGGSQDGSIQMAQARRGVTVLHNPERVQSAALNVAIDAAAGEVVVRVDARTVIEPDYVRRCVDALQETGAAMVGGAQRAVGTGPWGRAVAAVYDTPLGSGGAPYRDGEATGWVDTVYLGAYRADLALAVGGYDEARTPNEDAEFALRMGQRGGVWLDARIRCTYKPRDSIRGLAEQQYRYGQARLGTALVHRRIAGRQLAAPALVLGLLSPWRRPVAVLYGGALVAAGLRTASSSRSIGARVPVALGVMHLSWGAGFLRAAIAAPWRRAG